MTKEIQHCVICAWRGDCKLRFSLMSKNPLYFYCPYFTRDLTIKNPEEVIKEKFDIESENDSGNSSNNSD